MNTQNNLFSSKRHRFSTDSVLNLTAEQLEVRNLVAGQIDRGEYLLESQSCCICSSDSSVLVSERDRYGLMNSTVLCQECGLLRTEPVLRPEDYANFYYHSYRTLYFEEKFATDEFFESQRRGAQPIIEYLSKSIALPNDSLMLDVGCGSGGMVQAFVDRGYRGIGIDYDANYLQKGQGRGLDLRQGNVFSFQNEEKPKLVIYSHVLEHVNDPNIELQAVRTQLHDDGYLYVELPGIKRDLRAVYKADLIRFFHIAHLYHFTLKTLTNLLQRNGFELVAGNEVIRSVWKKGETRPGITSDYQSVRNYLVLTERFRRPLAAKALLNLKCLQAAGFFLRKLGLYGMGRRVYRKLVKK